MWASGTARSRVSASQLLIEEVVIWGTGLLYEVGAQALRNTSITYPINEWRKRFENTRQPGRGADQADRHQGEQRSTPVHQRLQLRSASPAHQDHPRRQVRHPVDDRGRPVRAYARQAVIPSLEMGGRTLYRALPP